MNDIINSLKTQPLYIIMDDRVLCPYFNTAINREALESLLKELVPNRKIEWYAKIASDVSNGIEVQIQNGL